MAKERKKINRKMRKQIRKTLGALFLISAITVAAIPVENASAAGTTAESSLTWDDEIGAASKIPLVSTDEKQIYTTGDGMFQFAYVRAKDTDTNKIAVILGYNGTNLPNNTLTVPNTVNAYMKYTENLGTNAGYVAVGRDGDALYYKVETQNTESDASGNEIVSTVVNYYPCYYTDRARWEDNELENFYYTEGDKDSEGNTIFLQTLTSDKQWIKNVSVAYIGNQYLVSAPEGSGQEWKVAENTPNEDKDLGIFANEGNIRTLIVGDNLLGIGNYAFSGCTSLESITLGNGLEEIGKWAFADCYNMKNISMNISSKIQYISDYTFYNCQALESFTIPINVRKIFDSAFEGCTGLTSVDLCGQGSNVGLNELGYRVFKNCERLESITFPAMLTDNEIHLNNFEGCRGLNFISVPNTSICFVGDSTDASGQAPGSGVFSIQDFANTVPSRFYFEGLDVSNIHEFTKKNAFAFKYLGEDRYEKIIVDKDTNAKLTYQVNSNNELIYFNLEGSVEVVEIPAVIGPYGISAINSGSFSGNCSLQKIIIPATVTRINDGAFKGCHNLEDVIFTNANTITYIGTESFATQRTNVTDYKCDKCGEEIAENPTLNFTGQISYNTLPFTYAMDPTSNINYGTQNVSYITYYSGWPSNLEVKYNPEKDLNELKRYPLYDELEHYTKDSYPYMTQEYADAAKLAKEKYSHWLTDNSVQLTEYEWQIINSTIHVSLPEGIESIQTGLFSGKALDENGNIVPVSGNVSGGSMATPNKYIQSLTMNSVEEIEPYSFTGCDKLTNITINGGATEIGDYAFACAPEDKPSLKNVTMNGGGAKIGDYAFLNNAELTNVTLSSTVNEIGRRPFKDCPKMTGVDFSGSPYFTCENAIIYGLKDGNKDSIVECMESRGETFGSSTVGSAETAGITSIAEEAFMDCEGIGSVDLSASNVAKIPQNAFANTSTLYSVVLPYGCTTISKNAFTDSNLRYIEIPNTVSLIDQNAFDTNGNRDEGDYHTITFYCEPGSAAAVFADEYESIVVTDRPVEIYYNVYFWDYDQTILKTESVPMGGDATPPADPEREGYRFIGWLPDYTNVSRDLDIVAQYEKLDSEETKYTVNFYGKDDQLLYTQKVAEGEDAFPPQAPAVEGYKFIGWRPAITNITKDTDTYAQYEKLTSGNGGNGGNGDVSGGDGNNGGNGGNGGNNQNFYTLTVENGNGSGSYLAGTVVIISAKEPASTQEFDAWKTDSADVTLASSKVAATTFTMPAHNVTVTATFKPKSNSSSGGGNNNDNNGGNNSDVSGGNNGGIINRPGNTVIIDKNGFSNTDVISIKVNGSSDNFTVRITDDADATEQALRALMNEYGSLENIKYFPMDISLYDATGTKKITDTTGLSVDITLPIPDSLIPYAGNNKVAGVVNEKLDKLTPKFTSIDGVACMTFKAEHFSPYVIYVDTSNLTAGDIVDESPKTGDGIHPKWFLALGLLCISAVLFAKKDKIQPKVSPQRA